MVLLYISLIVTSIITAIIAYIFLKPVDGVWSEWKSSPCLGDCGNGIIKKTRTCTPPKNGGKECQGKAYEDEKCFLKECPIDGEWSEWVKSDCSTTCGPGISKLTRTCTPPLFGGAECEGESSKEEPCNLKECPIDGGWSDWKDSDCSTTCGPGTITKTRTCSNPAPAHGGKACEGDAIMVQQCNLKECPVDGKWSDWTSSTCSATCGPGTITKTRTCSNPAPAHGGKTCDGDSITKEVCNLKECPVDGGWSSWTAWDCSTLCGPGISKQTRTCSNPAPLHGGKECEGESSKDAPCNLKECELILPQNGLIAWYDAKSFDGKIIKDKSNAGNNVTEISGTLINNGTYLSGTTNTKIKFNNQILPPVFTFIHVARYTANNKNRIFSSISGNNLSGFWSGNIGVSFFEGWKTPSKGIDIKTKWLLSVDSNKFYRANGTYISQTPKGNGVNFGINSGPYPENSDFDIAEIIVYNRELTLTEIQSIEQQLTLKYN